jgi:hypothetical protein
MPVNSKSCVMIVGVSKKGQINNVNEDCDKTTVNIQY